MKFSEIKDMTLVELTAKSRDLRQEMFNLRLQQASAQLEKTRAACARLRRDIARLETRFGTAQQSGLTEFSVWLRPPFNRKQSAVTAKSGRRRHLRQDGQDDHRAGAAPVSASALQESRDCLLEVLRA
jgi:ribosomal protein L29